MSAHATIRLLVMQIADTLFIIIVVILSAIVHEVMHGAAADWLGDKTARYAGRLTLNPLVHIDMFGSILLPIMLVAVGSPIFFGYAKPVPYNPYNLRPGRFSEAIVAIAGPLSNALIACFFGLVIRLGFLPSAMQGPFFLVIVVNIMLMIFNMIPVPPLDGSKVFASLLPEGLGRGYARVRGVFEGNPILGMVVAVLIINGLGASWTHLIYTIAGYLAGAQA